MYIIDFAFGNFLKNYLSGKGYSSETQYLQVQDLRFKSQYQKEKLKTKFIYL